MGLFLKLFLNKAHKMALNTSSFFLPSSGPVLGHKWPTKGAPVGSRRQKVLCMWSHVGETFDLLTQAFTRFGMQHWPNAGPIMGRRRRRWPIIDPAMGGIPPMAVN